ncbi:transcriptional regulator [Trabulsiella odontotermitis]|uniref:transcriptional regulator n=2 Tax=Trabulsiella odontotermitis TaxID=379893 RepID=UPI0009C16A21|nr:transcriptional regulator [Trabulsiella odontotermitis]
MMKAIHCISCGLSCQLYPDVTVKSSYCAHEIFSIWPDGNNYLKSGFINQFLLKNRNNLLVGFIFVDFSLPYLRWFTDEAWIDYLTKTGMRIVIITDKSLMPLANYWITKSDKIHGIIYADDDELIMQKKIKRLFMGQSVNTRHGRTLNFEEYTLLKRFVSGSGFMQAIKIDNINAKKVYVHKYRLEQKLGGSIRNLISQAL